MWKKAFTISLPVLMGYIPLGMAFAVLWLQKDLPWQFAVVTSVFLYAGAMQFLLVGMLSSQAGLLEIALANLAVNLRHVFYGLSYPINLFSNKNNRFALFYGIFSLTDEAYSLVANLTEEASASLVWRVQLLCQTYWVLGTILGVVIGMYIPDNWIGFDFALVALFVVLAQGHFYFRQRHLALWCGVAAICFSLLIIDSKQQLTFAILLAIALLFLGRKYKML